jgi:hypothetical protein
VLTISSHLSNRKRTFISLRVRGAALLPSSVPSTCPSLGRLTATRGLRQGTGYARSPGPPQRNSHVQLVPKLTVRLQFPPPLQTRKVLRGCGGEEFPYCALPPASPAAGRLLRRHAASGRSCPPPPAVRIKYLTNDQSSGTLGAAALHRIHVADSW